MAEAYVTRDELAGELRGLREEMAGMRRELRAEIAELRSDLNQLRSDLNQLRRDLNDAVALLTQRIDGLERTMNRLILVFGTVLVFMLLLQIVMLARMGL